MLRKIAIAFAFLSFLFACAGIYASRVSATVRLSHVLNAPVEKVWKLWSDPDSIKKWWSPHGFTAPVVKSDFRVGGNFLLSMRDNGGRLVWNTGTYQEIVPQKKIVSTMSFSDEQGKIMPGSEVPVPGKWPDAVSITVEFKDLGGKQTEVTITEEGIPMIMYVFAKMGWSQQFEKFERLL